MKTISIECSSSPVSVAISENGKIIFSDFSNKKVTHSETLLPMIENALNKTNLSIRDIDTFAVAAGPGSFTGIRIGISAVKGLAASEEKLCFALSTLEAMAYLNRDFNGVICPVMDARCNQVYNALFECKNGHIKRLCDDRALMCDQLIDEIDKIKEKILIVGDGTEVLTKQIKNFENIIFFDDDRKFQKADGVALLSHFGNCSPVPPQKLLPFYLRLPHAERELKQKKGV